MIPYTSKIIRIVLGGLLVCGLMGASQCEDPTTKARNESLKKSMEEEIAIEPTRRILEDGESVRFTFKPDGIWHPAPYILLHDKRIRIELVGESRLLGPAVVSFRVGKMLNLVSDKTDFKTTQPGSISFRIPPDRMHMFDKDIEVEITCVE